MPLYITSRCLLHQLLRIMSLALQLRTILDTERALFGLRASTPFSPVCLSVIYVSTWPHLRCDVGLVEWKY